MAGTAGPTPGAGYISNPKKRKAIEEHAEQLATAHYEGQGWTVEKLGKPYDLHCTRGTDERHVEVKGTTGAATSVELTNEVLHAPGTRTTLSTSTSSATSRSTPPPTPTPPAAARSRTTPTGSRPRKTSAPASTSTASPISPPEPRPPAAGSESMS
ncbi:protein NO VEIN domain-containing protein [Streptomyces althioticus]